MAASYAIALTAAVPEPSTIADAGLPALLDDADARQALHVTFGSVLGDPGVGARLCEALLRLRSAYANALVEHFARHLDPLRRLA